MNVPVLKPLRRKPSQFRLDAEDTISKLVMHQSALLREYIFCLHIYVNQFKWFAINMVKITVWSETLLFF